MQNGGESPERIDGLEAQAAQAVQSGREPEALKLWAHVDLPALFAKSRAMTTFFIDAVEATCGGHGLTLLPYFDGERTPNRPGATGILRGLRTDVSREELARATVEGVACGLVDALDSLRTQATVDGRVMLVGGLAQSAAFRRVLAGLVDVPIIVSDAEQAVATGAAVQAAAVLEQVEPTVVQERWGLGRGVVIDDPIEPADLRERYAQLRDLDR
jgi:xylulokinase